MRQSWAGVMRFAARRAAKHSISQRTSKVSSSSWGVGETTRAPPLGTSTTNPSPARRRNASRTGVRLTPSWAARAISGRRSPGPSCPVMNFRSSSR